MPQRSTMKAKEDLCDADQLSESRESGDKGALRQAPPESPVNANDNADSMAPPKVLKLSIHPDLPMLTHCLMDAPSTRSINTATIQHWLV